MIPKKKVLILISSLTFGGAEKQTIDLINNIDTSRIELFLCCLKREEDLRQDINTNQLTGQFCLDRRHKFDINILFKLKNIIRETRPEIVMCVDLYPALFAHLSRFLFRCKFRLIQVLHMTIMKDRYNDIIVKILYKNMINCSDDIVFVCKNQMEHWLNNHGIKQSISRIIYNGIDIEHFRNTISSSEISKLKNQLGILPKDIIVGICAAMRPEKRHINLIDAAHILIEKGLPVKIMIIGDGQERRSIEDHIDRSKMRKHVIMVGFQKDVRPFLAVSDIMVITSVAVETFSIAILEAMAMGRPIVASCIGGASEQVIDGKNGFLFPPGDTTALAEKMGNIIKNDSFKYMGEQSRKFVMEKFTSKLMVKKYEDLLLEG